ncbi:S8 family serine peptidase [Bdellovibrio sp. HCB2-146]|uniref:S8 family serine peptidase n=1 Tax=Bdellovibrio sp. HCB2-146 TaxID=3394362 RepID=UPI0039BC6183
MQKRISSILISGLLIAGCSSEQPGQVKTAGFLDGLYSTRPTVTEPTIAILKLANPAILETAERKEGKLQVDPELVKAIQEEQEQTIKALQAISPDIRVLIRYRLVLNGLAVWAPAEVLEKIKGLPNVTMSEKSGAFGRPVTMDNDSSAGLVGPKTSVKYIGSEAAYEQNIRGEGTRVGIIDTGVDYTHKMFLGEGTEAAYKAVNPALPNAAFPNKKVVGGIDLVGTEFNSASPDYRKRIPVPDTNPIDEAGHGTHVAGTVGGLGDGVNTYDGVAPAADLYAIKVFGAKGSTSDEVVIAALEYSADPAGDLSFKDQLDVVNLSLGSSYGNPHIMYNTAIKNLVRGGTVVVASGGNSGDQKFIVGAPGISDDAISVASSVDNMTHNVEFPTVEFKVAADVVASSEFVEGAFTKPLKDIPTISGEVVYAGLADKDFDQALQDQLKGRIALIDRGAVNFTVKVDRALKAGAIAVIVAQNSDEAPFLMGGADEDTVVEIPSVMITKKAGLAIREKLASSVVVVDLKKTGTIEKAWLADTISTFSSRGPRSEDGVIKPEISSPGTNIISAAVGGGANGVKMSGTSMAAPHIAGVMALLKQKFPALDTYELKSVLLSHGKVIADADKKTYTVSRQGSGRVQVAESLKAKVVTIPSTLSFGITDLEKQKTMALNITVKNISTEAVTLTPSFSGSAAMKLSVPEVSLAAGESKTITVKATITAPQSKEIVDEVDGFLSLKSGNDTLVQIPALVVTRKISQINAKPVVVHATSAADAAGSFAEVEIANAGINQGVAYLFNLISLDERKKDAKPDASHNRNCDLQSAGYRVVERDGARILQVALKLYEGMTTWNRCEVNVQIDGNADGQADQELAGLPMSSLAGLTGDKFVSLLVDANKARELRKKFEAELAATPDKAAENYATAALAAGKMHVFDNSTLAIVEADISQLALADTGELALKVSTTHEDSSAIEYDDYLGNHDKTWQKVSVNAMGQAYTQIPEVVTLTGQSSQTVSLQRGYGSEELIMYTPFNRAVRDQLLQDSQSQVIPVAFAEAK